MEYACGNIFIRVMRFAGVGDSRVWHAHNFDHALYCKHGPLRVDSRETVYGDGSAAARAVGERRERRIVYWRDRPRWQIWAPHIAQWLWRRWERNTSPGEILESIVMTEQWSDENASVALIPAFRYHSVTSMVDGGEGHCIYAHHTPQGDVVQEYTGWRPAYE